MSEQTKTTLWLYHRCFHFSLLSNQLYSRQPLRLYTWSWSVYSLLTFVMGDYATTMWNDLLSSHPPAETLSFSNLSFTRSLFIRYLYFPLSVYSLISVVDFYFIIVMYLCPFLCSRYFVSSMSISEQSIRKIRSANEFVIHTSIQAVHPWVIAPVLFPLCILSTWICHQVFRYLFK